jgi:hypothetical protein
MCGVGRLHSTHTTQQWTGNTGNTPGGTDETRVFAAVLERDDVRDDNLDKLEDTSTADALNGPGDDEPEHSLGGSTQRGANLHPPV